MICVVQKPFDGSHGQLISGQLVDTDGWKWTDQLINQGYIRPATQKEIAEAEEVEVPDPPVSTPPPSRSGPRQSRPVRAKVRRSKGRVA